MQRRRMGSVISTLHSQSTRSSLVMEFSMRLIRTLCSRWKATQSKLFPLLVVESAVIRTGFVSGFRPAGAAETFS